MHTANRYSQYMLARVTWPVLEACHSRYGAPALMCCVGQLYDWGIWVPRQGGSNSASASL